MGPRKRITVRKRGIKEAVINPCNRSPKSCQKGVCNKNKNYRILGINCTAIVTLAKIFSEEK
jgi:hypothetical protein